MEVEEEQGEFVPRNKLDTLQIKTKEKVTRVDVIAVADID